MFFDVLDLKWEYEPEGYELPSGMYLPDFKVDYPDCGARWFECKGDLRQVTDAEWARLLEFETMSGLVVLDGTPDMRMYQCPSEICSDVMGDLQPRPYKAQNHAFNHERFGVSLWSYKGRPFFDEHSNFFCYEDMEVKTIKRAVDAARSARFEHGQRGAT